MIAAAAEAAAEAAAPAAAAAAAATTITITKITKIKENYKIYKNADSAELIFSKFHITPYLCHQRRLPPLLPLLSPSTSNFFSSQRETFQSFHQI